MSTLELRDIEVVYHQRHKLPNRAVAGVTLDVNPGQIVGLVGESGCGKSTLGRVAVGLLRPTRGTVSFDGAILPPLSRKARPARATHVQMVFQNPNSSLNPRRRIGTQIADAMAIRGHASKAERLLFACEQLEKVGLSSDVARRFPHEFSGGQKQRIAIARALAASPSVIVLDEPLSALDASAQALLANQLVSLGRDLNIGLLLISHDLGIVRQVADVVAVMYLGKIVEHGPTALVWTDPLHPYSEALIGAIPRPDGNSILPEALPGEVPDPARPPTGCRFHPRCKHAFERCTAEEPTLEDHHEGREVACWLRGTMAAQHDSISDPRVSMIGAAQDDG